MVRKRSLSSVLDKNPTTTSSSRITVRSIVQPRRNRKVPCFCSNCEGSLVEVRTKAQHELLDENLANVSEDNLLPPLPVINEPSEVLENPEIQENIDCKSYQLTTLNEQKIDEVQQDKLLPRKCKPRYTSTRVLVSDVEQENSTSRETAKDQIYDENEEDNEPADNISEIFEDYSCPSFELLREPNVAPTNNQILWILLWIMKFRLRFNISEVATEALIKFIKLVLDEIGGIAYEKFPATLYKARNSLGIEDQFHSFVVCTKCNKLYNKQEVKEFRQDGILAIMKCQHIKFSNSSRRRMCQIPLSHQIRLLNEVTN